MYHHALPQLLISKVIFDVELLDDLLFTLEINFQKKNIRIFALSKD